MELHSFSQLLEKYQHHKDEILFVFDVDLVITMAADLAYHPLIGEKYQEHIDPLMSGLEDGLEELVYSIIASDAQRKLVDDRFPEVFRTLSQMGHKALALTAQLAITYQDVDTVQLRLKELRSFGIEFNSSFSHIESFWFEEMIELLGGIPHYCEGIIFSNGVINSKGAVLKAFLQRAGYVPKKVVFLDDMKDNVLSVKETLAEEGIPCDAWQYVGIYRHPDPAISCEEAVRKWQFAIQKAHQVHSVLKKK